MLRGGNSARPSVTFDNHQTEDRFGWKVLQRGVHMSNELASPAHPARMSCAAGLGSLAFDADDKVVGLEKGVRAGLPFEDEPVAPAFTGPQSPECFTDDDWITGRQPSPPDPDFPLIP